MVPLGDASGLQEKKLDAYAFLASLTGAAAASPQPSQFSGAPLVGALVFISGGAAAR
jgi:hypothetical protein